jgi:hypothetical protein
VNAFAFAPYVVLAGFLIAGAIAGIQRARRRAAIPEVAASKGLHFSSEDPFGTTQVAFPLFREGDGRQVESVMWLEGDIAAPGGVPSHVFDYGFYRIHHDKYGRETKTWHWFSCAVSQVQMSLPELRIAQRTAVGDVLDHLEGEPISFESEEFNQTFRVTSVDRRFASALVDPQMMEFLLQTKGAVSFETLGRFVLVAGTQVAADELPILLGLADAFVKRIPAAVAALYPPVLTDPAPVPVAPVAAGDDADPADAWDPTPGVDYDLDGHPVTSHTEDPWHDHPIPPHDSHPPDRTA